MRGMGGNEVGLKVGSKVFEHVLIRYCFIHFLKVLS